MQTHLYLLRHLASYALLCTTFFPLQAQSAPRPVTPSFTIASPSATTHILLATGTHPLLSSAKPLLSSAKPLLLYKVREEYDTLTSKREPPEARNTNGKDKRNTDTRDKRNTDVKEKGSTMPRDKRNTNVKEKGSTMPRDKRNTMPGDSQSTIPEEAASVAKAGSVTWEEFVAYLTHEEEWEEHEEWMQQLEELEELSHQPIAVNSASKEALQQISFLTDRQIEDIRTYVARHNGMKTLYELAYIPSIGYYERRFLPLFLQADSPMPSYAPRPSARKRPQQELLTRMDIPFYHREGFLFDRKYAGSRLYHKMRYTLKAPKHWFLSLHTERDSGEKGIDSYGGQCMLSDWGIVQRLIVGDFRVGFGEGLLFNQAFMMGKSVTLGHADYGLRPQQSTAETRFMRGVGLTLQQGNWRTTLLVSHHKLDATLRTSSLTQTDEMQEGTTEDSIQTLLTSGYHRTQSERAKKRNVTETTLGANLTWARQRWRVGATGYYLHMSHPFVHDTTPYKEIAPRGKHFGAVGLNYSYEAYRWKIAGETAYDLYKHGLATLHTLHFRLTPRYQFTASPRFYSLHYYSFYAAAVSENTHVQNESGLLLRMDANPAIGWQLTFYADLFYHPWPRYGIPRSSRGNEEALQVRYALNRQHSLSAQYQRKDKAYSDGQQTHHRLRLLWQFQPHTQWRWQTTAALHTAQHQWGKALAQSVRYEATHRLPLRLQAEGIYFHSPEYRTRLYLYEPSLVNQFAFAPLFDHGCRFVYTSQISLWKARLRLEAKYSVTRYFDRHTQGSGSETIYSATKNDLILQVRLKI